MTVNTERAKDFRTLQEEILAAVKELHDRQSVMNHSATLIPNRNDQLDDADMAHKNDRRDRLSGETKPLQNIQDSLVALQSIARSIRQEDWILKHLHFDSMYDREDNMDNAEEGTFRWILDENNTAEEDEKASEGSGTDIKKPVESESANESHDPDIDNTSDASGSSVDEDIDGELSAESDEKTSGIKEDIRAPSAEDEERRAFSRQAFLSWLRTGNQVFHITGKAGSGKSTLMKFLCQHPRMKQELRDWAGDKKLVFAQFFFWNSGDKLQMSLQGLYQSLLFEALRQAPELIPEVFSEQWEFVRTGKNDMTSEQMLFRAPKIAEALGLLLSMPVYQRHRFCFFIDGLDEYSGEGVSSFAHLQFAESLKKWASHEGIKICVSSRPHNEFMITFSNSQDLRIRLHELTREDIRTFSSQIFQRTATSDPVKNTCLSLVDNIVEKAEGVFLWARLTVHSLLLSASRDDPPEILNEQLESIPRDLDSVYDQILESIPPNDRRRSSRMLLFTVLNPFNTPLNALSYTWLDDLEKDLEFPRYQSCQKYSEEEISRRVQIAQRQLAGYTRGMLEVVTHHRSPGVIPGLSAKVEFFHRTLRDYLANGSRRKQLEDQFPDFNPVETYTRLRLAEIIFLLPETEDPHANPGVSHMDLFKIAIEPLTAFMSDESGHHELPLDLLERYRCTLLSHQTLRWYNEFQNCQYSLSWQPKSAEPLSFLHFAAYLSQQRYTVQEVSKDQGLLKPTKNLSLLLSALAGANPDLVLALLNMGAAVDDKIDVSYSMDQETPTIVELTISDLLSRELGARFTGWNRLYELDSQYRINRLCVILEYFLRRGMSTEYFFHLKKDWGVAGIPYIITLQQIVSLINPPNLGSLLPLFNRRTKSFFQLGSLLNRFMPSIKLAAKPVENNRMTVAQFPGDTANPRDYAVWAIFLGNLELPGWYQFRLY